MLHSLDPFLHTEYSKPCRKRGRPSVNAKSRKATPHGWAGWAGWLSWLAGRLRWLAGYPGWLAGYPGWLAGYAVGGGVIVAGIILIRKSTSLVRALNWLRSRP
eukprot:15711772-Heterocapsa_arctica.AAC.1